MQAAHYFPDATRCRVVSSGTFPIRAKHGKPMAKASAALVSADKVRQHPGKVDSTTRLNDWGGKALFADPSPRRLLQLCSWTPSE